jgi:predicted DNA-binding protein (MmcQ/YjbR family)
MFGNEPKMSAIAVMGKCFFLKENRRGKPLLNLKLIKRKSTTLVNKNTKPKKEK